MIGCLPTQAIAFEWKPGLTLAPILTTDVTWSKLRHLGERLSLTAVEENSEESDHPVTSEESSEESDHPVTSEESSVTSEESSEESDHPVTSEESSVTSEENSEESDHPVTSESSLLARKCGSKCPS